MLPEEAGGAGMDLVSFGLLNEELGRGCSSVRSLLTVHSMVCRALFRWGSREQKERWLRPLASGQTVAAFALTEPEAGSDAQAVQTSAAADGDAYLLSGRKKWVSFGQVADLFLVFARCGEGPAAFLVERGAPGLRVEPISGMLGVRASMLAELHLSGCRVPRQNLLGGVGFGLSHVASAALDYGRYSVAWGCVGIAQACLEACLRYTGERRQFGAYLKDHQLIQRMIARMVTGVKAAEPGDALAKLEEFGLGEYFIHPQINWDSKVASIRRIAGLINIGLDAVAFVDDQPGELEEVKFSLPEVLCLDSADLGRLPGMPELTPRFVTEDSRQRRLMYLADAERRRGEEEFVGTREEFLATLDMRLTISRAKPDDLRRAEELTVRTNQLNTTGYTYSYEELDRFRRSEGHRLLMAGFQDKYGGYGKVGLVLLECGEGAWTIKLLLMSCRVMSRGLGAVLLNYVVRAARREGVRLLAEFVANGRNRVMHLSYKFAGFREARRVGDLVILENDLSRVEPFPPYLKIEFEGDTARGLVPPDAQQ